MGKYRCKYCDYVNEFYIFTNTVGEEISKHEKKHRKKYQCEY